MTSEAKHERRLDFLENAPCAFHSLGPDGVLRDVNATWLRWLGYTRDEVEGKLPLQAVLTEASQAIFARNFPKFMREGRLDDLELVMRRKDGSTFTVLVNASAVLDAEGKFLWSRSGFVDISRRKRAEEHNQRLIDAAPDPTVVVDADGKIEFANLQVERTVDSWRSFAEDRTTSHDRLATSAVARAWPSAFSTLRRGDIVQSVHALRAAPVGAAFGPRGGRARSEYFLRVRAAGPPGLRGSPTLLRLRAHGTRVHQA